MAKYRFKFKKNVVMEYLQGKGGTHYLSKKHSINLTGNNSILRKWVKAYQEFNEEGIKSSIKNNSYTFEIKNIESLFKRIEEVAPQRRSTEQKARIICDLRRLFKLKDILAVLNFPKATYMYWQKRFDRENPDKEIEENNLEIRKEHKYCSSKNHHRYNRI